MTVVLVTGDATTTTCLAFASAADPDTTVVVEADRRGGSLAAWLDVPATPSLTTAVTTVAERGSEAIEQCIRRTSSGPRVLCAPIRAAEADRAVEEAGVAVFALLAARPDRGVLIDAGPPLPGRRFPAMDVADVVVAVHRQTVDAHRAAAVRVERFAEHVEHLRARAERVHHVIIGERPFEPVDIVEYVAGASARAEGLEWSWLPEDPLAAAVFSGRTRVSARRFDRLPLIRAARGLARAVIDGPVAGEPVSDAAAGADREVPA